MDMICDDCGNEADYLTSYEMYMDHGWFRTYMACDACMVKNHGKEN